MARRLQQAWSPLAERNCDERPRGGPFAHGQSYPRHCALRGLAMAKHFHGVERAVRDVLEVVL
jgi:hypothetical protein